MKNPFDQSYDGQQRSISMCPSGKEPGLLKIENVRGEFGKWHTWNERTETGHVVYLESQEKGYNSSNLDHEYI